MRSLVILALLASTAHAKGWCPPVAPASSATTKRFAVDSASFTVTSAREPDRAVVRAYDRDPVHRGLALGFDVSIVDDKLEIVDNEHWCRGTGAGCIDAHLRGRHVELRDPVPQRSCIDYAYEVEVDALVVGVGTEMRVYRHDKGTNVRSVAKLTTPRLELIGRAYPSPVILQEPGGSAWTARWNGTAMLFARIADASRLIALAPATDDMYAIAGDALYQLDRKTLARRWRMDGEVWAVLPGARVVLTIDRSKSKPRVVLARFDANGKRQREVVVYEGLAVRAQLFVDGKRSLVNVITS